MNRAFISPMVRPNLPLRRPASGPGMVSPTYTFPQPTEQVCYQTPEQPISEVKGAISREPNRPVCAMDLSPAMLVVPGSATVKLCNYCGQEGQLRCSGCKKTNYCSVSCQSEDWPAHRHVCKTAAVEVDQSEKPKEGPSMSATAGTSVAEPKVQVNDTDAPQIKRVYLQDLSKNDIPKGTEIQALVVEVQSPSRFFIHVHNAAVEESLRKISIELQKTCGNLPACPHRPDAGEICAVKFSLDQHWYRGLVQTVSGDQQQARVLYIDFGNEEDVPFDRIRPLPDNIERTAPNALQCRVAGVEAATGGWKEECNLFLKQLLYGKSIAIHVLHVTGDGQRVYAVDMKRASTDKMLSTFLLEQGYAVKEVSPTTEQEIDSMLNASVKKCLCQSDTTSNSTEVQHPAHHIQEVGSSFTAVVTYLLSPADIVCQVVENSRVIQELQVKLKEHCLHAQPSDSFKPTPGTICCALFSEDKEWYRAKVLKYASDTRASVSLIDYGNVEEMELTHMLPISTELLALAAQGIPCTLAGLLAPEGSWPEQAVWMLKRLVSNRFLRVKVRSRQAGRLQVAMVDESSNPQTDMGVLLVSMGYAVAEQKAPPPESLQQMTLQPKTGASPEAIPKAPVLNSPKALKLDWSCAELPCEGQLVVIVATVIENPSEFYCYHYIPEDLQALAKLSAELLKHCQGNAAPLSPVVGEPCCALYSDGSWYRAMVQSVEPDGKVQVYFVDYGNSSTVEVAHLRTIEQRLLTLPFLAIRCWLAGIEPVGGQWDKAAIQRMQELCAGQYLTGRVVSITERGYGIELKSDSHNIATTLLSEQLAKQRAPSSANQSQLPAPPTAILANQSQPPTLSTASSTGQSQAPITRPPSATSQSQVLTNATSQPQASVAHPSVATNQSQAPVAHSSSFTNQSQAPTARSWDATNQSQTPSPHPSPTTIYNEAPAMAPPTKIPAVDQCPASQPSAAFPLDWKTEELPHNQPFTPRLAAAISPELFFIMSLTEGNSDKLQSLITEVEKYCGQAAPSQSKPQPGSACCAQFSGDKKWYRAVVLDINSSKASVIYADFGNAEEVPFSRILPIPQELLQTPFRIVRCSLSGKERFPSVWPEGALELFGTLLSGKLEASAQAFNGSVNILDVTHQVKGPISSLLLQSLQGPQAGASTPEVPEKGKVVPQPPVQHEQQQQQPPQPSSPPQPRAPAKVPPVASAALASAKPHDSTPKQQDPSVTGSPKKVPEAKDTPGLTGCVGNDVTHTACCCSELASKMEKLEDLIVRLMQQINRWQNSVVH